MTSRLDIEKSAVDLLLKQQPRGEFFLSMLDFRHLNAGGGIIISDIDSYERATCSKLPSKVEGCTVSQGKATLILYDGSVSNKPRINWTIAHEIGHALLSHRTASGRSEREANLFAASLLMPEAVIRYLDHREGRLLMPSELSIWLPASNTALSRRRHELELASYIPTEEGNRLINLLFGHDIF